MSATFLIIGLIAVQLNPSLTPKVATKPSLPRIDENACPFEGCQFGKWTAAYPVHLYSTWKRGRTALRVLKKGESVVAVTGINIVLEPMEIQVTAPIPQYQLKPGDIVFGYMNLGEGFFNAWFNGYWVENFDGTGVAGRGCFRECNAKLLKAGRSEWWVKIKTKDGTIGWTNEDDKFEGTDAFASR